jgi:Asp-tRNA(Asn)/Glu-tRNA(Gln) amidotransferase A subunit family amidase
MVTDPARLSATAAARLIEAGSLSPVALMEACLDRIAKRDPVVRAMAYLDPKAALDAAKLAKPGRLRGLPIGVKDVLDTFDFPTEYNSPIWQGHRPKADCAAVAWTRQEGGVVVGKTVTTEFATRHPGRTTNPHNQEHTPGGSSSGSAAGVADFFFPLAFGTQTAGSVIRPAAFCGVVGYKPSFGLISRIGMKLMSDSLDTVGVIARNVADCALFAGAVSGRDLGDPDRHPGQAPRIGICRTPFWESADTATQALLEHLTGVLARAGASVQARELPPSYAALREAQPLVMNAESARALGWEMTNHRDKLSEVLRERMEWGLAQSPAALDAARALFTTLQAQFPSAMEDVDILLTPSAPGEAPKGLSWTGEPTFNALWTALHVPCVTVPAGQGPAGLPLGIQIIGRQGDDRQTLAWAQWVAGAVG